jgi:hypothetical protein
MSSSHLISKMTSCYHLEPIFGGRSLRDEHQPDTHGQTASTVSSPRWETARTGVPVDAGLATARKRPARQPPTGTSTSSEWFRAADLMPGSAACRLPDVRGGAHPLLRTTTVPAGSRSLAWLPLTDLAARPPATCPAAAMPPGRCGRVGTRPSWSSRLNEGLTQCLTVA